MKCKNISLLLLVIAVFTFSGCNNCDGSEPVLTAAEESWLPHQPLSDSLIFINQKGKREVFVFMQRNLFTSAPDRDKLFKKTCPEDKTAEGIYEIGSAQISYPGGLRPFFRVHLAKDKSGISKTFHWPYLHQNQYFYNFNQHLDSLEIAGTMYKDVHIFENDTTFAANYQEPFTHKLYFSKAFGLIRYDNTGNEIWERQP
jgi:hypothetical protein